MTAKHERTFTLAWGVRSEKAPEDMTRQQLEDTLYNVAEFASKCLVETRALRRLIADRLEQGPR